MVGALTVEANVVAREEGGVEGGPDAAPTQISSGKAIRPAMALAATTRGLARYTLPGPLRPGKFRFCALTVTWSGEALTPGPALMQAPHEGSTSSAPALANTSR